VKRLRVLMSKRNSLNRTAEELEREASSRLVEARYKPDLRARQILLMEFEQLRALASLRRREAEPHKPTQ
jgi:hypothetical protein